MPCAVVTVTVGQIAAALAAVINQSLFQEKNAVVKLKKATSVAFSFKVMLMF